MRKADGSRFLYCACECTGDIRDRYCDLLVRYEPQDLAKAERLYAENPINGATKGYILYKKCVYCTMFHR